MFSNCQAIKLGRPKGNPWETRLQDENKNYFQEMKEEREKEKRRERERERKNKKLWEQRLYTPEEADFTDFTVLVCKVTKQRNKIRNSKIWGGGAMKN